MKLNYLDKMLSYRARKKIARYKGVESSTNSAFLRRNLRGIRRSLERRLEKEKRFRRNRHYGPFIDVSHAKYDGLSGEFDFYEGRAA